MYKLIAIDLDGTLLNSYGEISKENENAIKCAISKGAKVILTSGRTNTAIDNFAYTLGANEYMISGNGAAIYDLQRKQTIFNNYLKKSKILEIIKVCEEHSMYYNVYTEKSVITKALNYNTLYYYSENLKKPPEKWTRIVIVSDMMKYIEGLPDETFLKVTVCDSDKSIFQRILAKLKEDQEIDVLDVSHMSRKLVKSQGEIIPIEYYYTEITNKNVNKWNAIKFLIDRFNIKPEEVIAIGDNTNDKEMIEHAGLGVVVENGSPELKQIADEVTGSNDENGVASVIKKHLINNITELLQDC